MEPPIGWSYDPEAGLGSAGRLRWSAEKNDRLSALSLRWEGTFASAPRLCMRLTRTNAIRSILVYGYEAPAAIEYMNVFSLD